MKSLWRLMQQMRSGWISVTLFYVGLTGLAYLGYTYAQRLPNAVLPPAAQSLPIWASPEHIFSGLAHVWPLFAWGFGLQLLVQITWIFRRQPKDGSMGFLLKKGVWLSAHAGIFEELIFRYYAYLSFVLALVYADTSTDGFIGRLIGQYVNPIINWLTLGLFSQQFSATNWALGVAAIIGAFFFRSAHVHYGKFSKANVWAVGVIMFWLTFNFGLITAIAAHIIYDSVVFLAIAIASPLQPHHPNRAEN